MFILFFDNLKKKSTIFVQQNVTGRSAIVTCFSFVVFFPSQSQSKRHFVKVYLIYDSLAEIVDRFRLRSIAIVARLLI